MFKKTKIIGAVLLLASSNAMATLAVTTNDDANDLANEILGSGITISNATYIGTSTQSATFTDGLSSGIGIENGIILTSGNANLALGPNSGDATGASLGTAGDTDLNGLIPQTTNDAAVLEFDFETTGGDLFFNFVFASEEYNEFVNSSFNDVFAFFVDGTNIALAPNGDPASINNINCGNPLGAVGPNCSSYNNNDLSDGGPFFDIEYDGFTDVLTAEALGLGLGKHHIKIAIADAGDTVLDSAVFIQASSFSDKPTVPAPAPLALLAFGLMGIVAGQRKNSRKAA